MPAKTAKARIQKGKDLENYVARRLKETGLDDRAKRSIGSGSGTGEKADINTKVMILGQNIGIECKHTDKPQLKDWWRQARKLEEIQRIPVLIWKQTADRYADTKAIVSYETLLALIKNQKEHEEREPEYNWEAQRAIRAAADHALYAIRHLEGENVPDWRKKDARAKLKALLKALEV